METLIMTSTPTNTALTTVATITRTIVSEISYRKIKSGLYCYRTTGNPYTAFLDSKNLKLMLDGQGYSHKARPMTYAPPEYLRLWREVGVGNELHKWAKANDKAFDVWFAMEDPDYDVNNIVAVNGFSDHIIRLLDGRAYRAAVWFDYIQAQIHNGAYDLTKAHEILSKNPNVRELTAVERIPSYNWESHKSNTLSFKYAIPDDQMDMLVKAGTNIYRVVFDNDLLGLRAGGAAMFEKFYESVEPSSDEDDEDC